MTADPAFAELKEGRRRFLALIEDLRPDLHRYCGRMVGSIADGEDIARFLELPPTPRSCVILKDLLGYPLEELNRYVALFNARDWRA
jgi:DNA-directed RNA polymerase specialized sigma24 family protein